MSLFLKYTLFGIPIPYKIYRVTSETFNNDPFARSMRLDRHYCGEFSMAAVQSNKDMEDHSHVDVGHDALFVGIYDGFKGRITENDNNMTVTILREVVEEIENRFMEFARSSFEHQHQQQIGLVSSGCLICFIWRGTLYVANVGDSRAVLGSRKGVGPFKRLCVKQMVRVHSCENSDIKKELRTWHPDDNLIYELNELRDEAHSHICKGQIWTMKGLIQTSRCIGYAYMKKVPFTQRRTFKIPMGEQVVSAFTRPWLTSEPEVYSRVLKDTDRFVIFGSSGFWKLMSNELAARIVNTNPRDNVAKILVMVAIEKGANKKGKKYSDVIEIPKGSGVSGDFGCAHERIRPFYHDDITVIVVFLDKRPIGVRPEIKSYTCNDYADLPSEFTHFYHNKNV
ncbi:probable protein phosphatase 2C 43 [Vicia villosa]|uniref:probable protein phosphatase 2C 43 n=1 Tax=Vicia villosa TaxID=3911 RepID=UPI00273BBC2F|nr:probable protein phosphatase 2C 43 [Vicia villosa]